MSKRNIWATTLKACWSRRPRTELPRVPVHGVAAGMEREASAQYGVPAETGPLPGGSKRWSSSTSASSQVSIGKVVRELAGLAFVERSENVILLGPPGVGKTHLGVALGVKAADAGHRVLFMPLDKLIATLMKAKQENRLENSYSSLVMPGY